MGAFLLVIAMSTPLSTATEPPQIMIEMRIMQGPAALRLPDFPAFAATQAPTPSDADADADGAGQGFDFRAVASVSAAIASLMADSPDGAAVKVMSSPRLITLAGQSASMSIGEEIPYMVQRPDGSLVVETSSEATEGLDVELRAEVGDHGAVDLEVVRLRIRRMVGRQAMPGVPFDVGRPIIQHRETSARLALAPDHGALVRLPSVDDDDVHLLVFIWARVIEPAGQ